MQKYPFEVKKLTIDDLKLAPDMFQNELDGNAVVGKMAHYAQFFVEGVKTPVYYFRNVNPDSQRWCGISSFGEDPLEPQNGIWGEELAQEGTFTKGYGIVSNNPLTYEIETEDPYSLIRFTDDGHGEIVGTFKEGKDGSILDLTVHPFPVAMISHANEKQPAPYFQVNTWVEGTYMGKPVKGMGGFDRTYVVNRVLGNKEEEEKNYASTYRCNCALYSGIRKDGRKECVYALITDKNGKGVGMYYIDGEKPIVTDEVYLDADFYYLPYVNDNTVVYTKASWNIGPKTIHFDGKWGTKGFTAYPKVEKHGQSQCFGTWYEGDIPYEHIMSHTFNENSGDSYATRIKAMGFNVHEKTERR